jgi:hypothetical protein
MMIWMCHGSGKQTGMMCMYGTPHLVAGNTELRIPDRCTFQALDKTMTV